MSDFFGAFFRPPPSHSTIFYEKAFRAENLEYENYRLFNIMLPVRFNDYHVEVQCPLPLVASAARHWPSAVT